MRGAARLRDGGGRLFQGELPLCGLPVGGREETLCRGAPAAGGCPFEGRRRLFMGELPLRGATAR